MLQFVTVDASSQLMWTTSLQSRLLASAPDMTLAVHYLAQFVLQPESVNINFPMFDEAVVMSILQVCVFFNFRDNLSLT